MNTNKDIHIIAEAGTNHNGKISLAKKLVDIACESGANSIKFQMINPWGLYLPGKYEYGHYDIEEVIKLREKTQFSERQYKKLDDYCNHKGIPLTCSIFDREGLDLLLKFAPPYIKVASCDLNNTRLLRMVAETGKKIVVSTGMATLSEIEKTMKELSKSSNAGNIVLMHCISIYPARLEQCNLSFIEVLKHNFGVEIGFSDHTEGTIAACVALSKGATWFEKHFTISRRLRGLDHAHALEKDELAKYVSDIRQTNRALQSNDEKISPEERYTSRRARRSLYAARDIECGEKIADEDVLVVRPENEMQADEIDKIVGKKTLVRIVRYQPFKPHMFEK